MTLLDSLPGWELVLFFVLFGVFIIAGAVTVIIILSRLRWQFRVNILQDVDGSGQLKIIGRDKARPIAFGDGGEEIFLLKKNKKYKVSYGKRIGNKTIAWAVGNDGYWYNISLGDLDKRLMEIGVVPVDRDMRYATASVRKGIEQRYNDKTWMDKYGAIMYFGLFFITMLLFAGVMWFAFNQQIKVSQANAASLETAERIMELAGEVLSAIDNIKQGGGSGITPSALWLPFGSGYLYP